MTAEGMRDIINSYAPNEPHKLFIVDAETYGNCCQEVFNNIMSIKEYILWEGLAFKAIIITLGKNNGIMFKGVELVLGISNRTE